MLINNTAPVSKHSTEPQLATLYEDLQGNILKSHARNNVQLIFVQFTATPEQVKNWIATQVTPLVTPFKGQMRVTFNMKAVRAPMPDPGFCSFSLSKKGYAFLQLDPKLGDASFDLGLGNETVESDPEKKNWETNYQKEIHGIFILGQTQEVELAPFVAKVKTVFGNVVKVVTEETGMGLDREKEQFGFVDGISQPRFFSEDIGEERSTTIWNPFASLDLALVKDPFGAAFKGDDEPVSSGGEYSYGSFLVYRKLEQDVDGWNAEVVKKASAMGIDPGLFGAYAVGRFQDGTPVITHATPTNQKPFENDFDYSNDPKGVKCPFHAHIRKANPRGDSVLKGSTLERERRRRIARRAIPYETDGKKGLLFMCYQSSIIKQFEFMQNKWIDDVDFAIPGAGEDSVMSGIAAPVKKAWPTIHGGPGTTQLDFNHFVTMRGGEYFFTPSISALRSMAGLAAV